MRPEMKSTRNKIFTNHKRYSVCITFHCRRYEMKFRFGAGPRKTAHSVKANYFCLDEIKACADISFHIISFPVVFTWSFIKRNEVSFLSKWPQWNKTHNEFHFGLYHVNSYYKLTRHRNENISFRPKWNLM